MADWLIETFSAYPYLGVVLVFLACGFGAPFPEEIVLMFAGFVCFKGVADRETMMVVCGGAILFGDVVPFALGKIYGPSLLKIRLLRLLITQERLARFDVWFRRRGDAVVLISRFVPGLRLVSFFTAGSMKMSWLRFLALDGGGIVLVAPTFVWIGHHFGGSIEAAVEWVQRVERGILIAALSVGAVIGVWYWLRWRRRQKQLVGGPVEAYVEPSIAPGRERSGPVGSRGVIEFDVQPSARTVTSTAVTDVAATIRSPDEGPGATGDRTGVPQPGSGRGQGTAGEADDVDVPDVADLPDDVPDDLPSDQPHGAGDGTVRDPGAADAPATDRDARRATDASGAGEREVEAGDAEPRSDAPSPAPSDEDDPPSRTAPSRD